MAAFAMSTAKALVARPAASFATRGASGAARSAPAASAAVPAFGARAAAFRGTSFGMTATAPSISGAAFQRNSFSVSAFAGDEASEGGGGGAPVKLYVGNLSWGVDDGALNEVFSGYEVSDTVVVYDQATGRSRGFGFVTVPSKDAADKVIAALDGVVSKRPDFPKRPPDCVVRCRGCVTWRPCFSPSSCNSQIQAAGGGWGG